MLPGKKAELVRMDKIEVRGTQNSKHIPVIPAMLPIVDRAVLATARFR